MRVVFPFIVALVVLASFSCNRDDSKPCDQLMTEPMGEILEVVYPQEIYCQPAHYYPPIINLKKSVHIANDSDLKYNLLIDTAYAKCFKRDYKIDFTKHDLLVNPSRSYDHRHHNLNVVFNHAEKKVVFEDAEVNCPTDAGQDGGSYFHDPGPLGVLIPKIPPGYTVEFDLYTIQGD